METPLRDHISMSKRYERNLERWAVDSPKQALMLSFANTDEYQITSTDKGENNLLLRKFSLHDPKGGMEEAVKWVEGIDFKNCELCFVYGVGLGYSYLALRPWLKKNKKRMVVFLEDDLEVIKHFMATEVAGKMLKDPQVRLHYISSTSEDDLFFKTLYWNFALRPVVIASLPSYKKNKAKKLEELSHRIAFTNAYHNAMIDEYLNFGGPFFFNYYQNLLKLPVAFEGNKLFGKFKNVPAIICGAGPSLNKQFDLVRGLKDKAIIFGCGSAMNALNAAGIQPHFGAAIDPNPLQMERLKANSAKNVPYFYRNRVHPEALDLVDGPRLYVSGCGGYDLADWFDEKLKIRRKELDEGYNVINFSIQIAKELGCNPIMIVGCDLAYTGLKSYAEGVETDPSVTIAQITTNDDFDQQAIVQSDIFGHPTFTLWKWVTEAKWIGEFAQKNPKTQIVNATEGGLGFPEVPNVSLKECVKVFLTQSHDLSSKIQEEIQAVPLSRLTKKKVVKAMEEIADSFRRCEGFLNTLIHEGLASIQKATDTKSVPDSIHSGAFALAEFELSEEPAYVNLLSNFNSIFSLLLGPDFDKIRHHMPRTPDWKKFVKSVQTNNKKFYFLRNTCQANYSIIKWAIEKQTIRP